MTFDLQPDDQVIAAGEQIGLMIFASDPSLPFSQNRERS